MKKEKRCAKDLWECFPSLFWGKKALEAFVCKCEIELLLPSHWQLKGEVNSQMRAELIEFWGNQARVGRLGQPWNLPLW